MNQLGETLLTSLTAPCGFECYRICLSYGFFAFCLWTRFFGCLELRS